MKIKEVLEKYGNIEISENLVKELCRSQEEYTKLFKQLTKDILENFNNIEIGGISKDEIVTIKREGDTIIVTDSYNDYFNAIDIEKDYREFIDELAYYLLVGGNESICNSICESIDRKEILNEFIKVLKREDLLNESKEVYSYL